MNNWNLKVKTQDLLYQDQKLNIKDAVAVASVVSNSMRPHRWQPPGSTVPGILQARIMEWVAISFSNACMHAKLLQPCPTL